MAWHSTKSDQWYNCWREWLRLFVRKTGAGKLLGNSTGADQGWVLVNPDSVEKQKAISDKVVKPCEQLWPKQLIINLVSFGKYFYCRSLWWCLHPKLEMTHNNICISNVRPHEVVEPTTSMFVVDPFFWQPLKGAVCHSCIYGLYSHHTILWFA